MKEFAISDLEIKYQVYVTYTANYSEELKHPEIMSTEGMSWKEASELAREIRQAHFSLSPYSMQYGYETFVIEPSLSQINVEIEEA